MTGDYTQEVNSKPHCVFITVSYNNCSSTEDYIKSFSSLEHSSDCLCIVVDNSTQKDLKLSEFIDKCRDNVVYVRQKENLGYISGCNFGYRYVSEYYNVKDAVIIYSNNDILFNTSNLISECKRYFSLNQKVALLAPSVFDSFSGKELNPFLHVRPSSSLTKKLKVIYSSYISSYAFNSFKKVLGKFKNNSQGQGASLVGEIYAAHGCVFIFRPVFLEHNLPDSDYFLYAEEVTIAELVRAGGFETHFLPSLSITHASHATTGSAFSFNQYKLKKNAINYIIEKYKW